MLTWQILILTQPSRAAMLEQLTRCLYRQFDAVAEDRIETLVWDFDKKLSLGENREAMRQAAKADYISFFDDDDLPAPDYVETISPLLDGRDYIGHQLQGYRDCAPMKMTYNSLQFPGWYEDAKGYYRHISHICPIRRDLALRVAMEGGFGEDCRWAEALRKLGIVQTEHVINKVMYHYLWRQLKNDRHDAFDARRMALLRNNP